MSLKTTFQIGFRDMRADLMRHHFTGWICVCVCVFMYSRPDIPHRWHHPFVMRTKLFPNTCWLRVKRATQTLQWKLYLQPSLLHRCCEVSFVWSLESSVPFGQMKGAMLVGFSNSPSGLSLCTHPFILTFIQQVRSTSILLQCIPAPW